MGLDLENFKNRKLSTDEYALARTEINKQIRELEDIELERGEDYLLLKWGGYKGGNLDNNPEAKKKLDEFYSIGVSSSAIMQENTERQKQLLCEIIDLVDGVIENDWDGAIYTKQQAKDYVMNYNN